MQDWVGGQKAHLGMLLRNVAETSTLSSSFAADGFARSIALRPKLVVTYQDASDAAEPVTSITSHAPNALVSGTVGLTASANDDGSVAQVEFFHGSTSIGVDTTAPWSVSWNTSALTVGSTYQLTAKATDEAGNMTVAPAQTPVKIRSAVPTASVGSVTQQGSPNQHKWDVTATVSDDVAVTKVEFLVDGDRFATDTGAPWAAVLDILAFPVFDGVYTVTVRAFDADGSVTESATSPLTVANTSGTKYKATFSTTAVPVEIPWDPAAGTQDQHPVDVTVTNTSTVNWAAASTKLRYRWIDAAGQTVTSPTRLMSLSARISRRRVSAR